MSWCLVFAPSLSSAGPSAPPRPPSLWQEPQLFSLIELHAGDQQRDLIGRQFFRVVAGDASGLGHLRRQQRIIPEDVFGLGLVERHGRALPVVAHGAAEAIHGMLVEDMTGMGAVRLRHIGHAGIVNRRCGR